MENASVRVLVVDDYEPFRRFICSTLRKRSELQIVGESSDGLEAVRRAEELQPDLIVLDVGLPSLNGIEAARRIRVLSPGSKILFISQESSAEVVREALALGAMGYVVKAQAGSELLVAVRAILEDRQFVSSGISGQPFTSASNSQTRDCLSHDEANSPVTPRKGVVARTHEVEFYSDDAAFVVGFTRFIEAALAVGNAVIAVATESHRQSLLEALQDHGVDIVAAIERGRYVSVDVAEALSTFMVNDLPNPARFFRVVSDLVAPAARATLGGRVAICGECGSTLWAEGKPDAAIQVEQLCSQLAKRYEMDILCGFSLSTFYREEDKQVFQKICGES